MIGDRLRRRRIEIGMGLRETARRIGISATYLSRIETGSEKSQPSEAVIRSAAEVLEDDFDALMSDAGRIPADVMSYVLSDPLLFRLLRFAKYKKVTAHDLFSAIDAFLESK